MSVSANTPPSRGMMMIAAYRAERLNQRPLLRTGLHRSHVERRMARLGGAAGSEAAEDAAPAAPMPAVTSAIVPKPADQSSIFAGLLRIVSAEQQDRVAGIHGADPAEVANPPEAVAQPEAALSATVPIMTPLAEIADADMHQADETEAASLSTQPALMDADPSDLALATPAAGPQSSAAQPAPAASEPEPEPAYDPPLAEIGFGPGMLIRLSQLGMHTTGDLALANAVELREALGDISRLVDVEAWIASAQRSTSTASP